MAQDHYRTSSREVFQPCVNHVRFQNFTTRSEAQALAVPGVDVNDLTGISFLEAVRRTRPGACKFLAEDATYYCTAYLGRDFTNDLCKAEHMLVFHGVLSEERFDDDVELSDAVDSDNLFWHVVGPMPPSHGKASRARPTSFEETQRQPKKRT